MFSRIVTVQLKQNHIVDLTKAVDEKVMPLLRTQEGFKTAVFLANPNGTEALAISVWDRKESADAYGRAAYTQVLEALNPHIDGKPEVKTFNVISSTLDKMTVAV